MAESKWDREDVEFESDGTRCAAWLYRPHNENRAEGEPPIVLMAHGFGGQRGFGLPAYAERFAARGMAVLLFDYRCFGASDGQPRDWVDHRRQHRDWRAAIAFARTIDGVDHSRIGLWGTSYSGGHVLSVAAREQDVLVAVSQVPMLHVMKSLRSKPTYMMQSVFHGLVDWCGALVGRSPHYVPTVATPDKFAALNKPGCDEGYRAKIPADADWQNRVTARSLLSSITFRPCRDANSVRCPVLFIIAEHDQLIRTKVSLQVTERVADAKVRVLPIDHFAVYRGDVFEQVCGEETDFLAEHLGLTARGDQ